MKRIATILLLTYYLLGVFFSPLGNFAFVHHLPEMYQQCKGEDPDMNLPDFLFEHVLNLEDVVAPFEQKGEKEEHEKPHQPFTQSASSLMVVVLGGNIFTEVVKERLFSEDVTIVYPLQDDSRIPSPYLSAMFRPPIAA